MPPYGVTPELAVFDVQVTISNRPGLRDPEGETILRDLVNRYKDTSVTDVRTSRLLRFRIEESTVEEAHKNISEMCSMLRIYNHLVSEAVIESKQVSSPISPQILQSQSATLIADYILAHNPTLLTMLHVIKLVYICHGWHLAKFNNAPLIQEGIQAWKYGPVIPSLYDALMSYKKKPITNLIYCQTPIESDTIKDRKKSMKNFIRESSRNLIDKVIAKYSNLSASQLVNITHQPGTPWEKCYVDNEQYIKIPNDMIKAHYVQLTRDNPLD